MKKQILLFVLTLLPMMANADDAEINGIYYNLNSTTKKAEVTYDTWDDYEEEYTPYRGDIEIPSSVIYNGTEYTVTSIGDDAFAPHYNDDDESYITSVTIPNSVTTIGEGAFLRCSRLISIIIPNSVTNIGGCAFSGCSGLTSIIIPNSVTTIGEGAFYGCSGLTSITIPSSVTNIGSDAFYGCSGLASITIPSSVTSIGNAAFSGCSGLKEVNFNATNCTHSPEIVYDYDYGNSEYYLPIFEGCTSLTTLNIGSNVQNIPNYAFSGRSGLTSVTIPNSVTNIGSEAFSGCSGLTSITIPSSVTSIGNGAFSGCSGLTSITIPSSVKNIGSEAFMGCSGLREVNYNATNCTSTFIFENCTSLTTLNIGSNVQNIPIGTFAGCSGLTRITIPSSVKTVGHWAFSGCSGLTNITIPSSVTSIGSGAFANCRGLTEVNFNATNCTLSPEIEDDDEFGHHEYYYPIFEDCTSLTTLNIGSNVQYIPNYAFSGCSGLTSITLPSSVTNIGDSAFEGCSGLTEVNYNATNCTSTFIFEKCTSLTTLNIGNNVQNVPDGAFNGCSGLTSITLPSSVTSIGNEAFRNCSGLTKITIGNSVETIGTNAFSDCGELIEVNYNATNCTSPSIFKNCTSLATLNIGSNVQNIPAYAFSGCTNLINITIPNSVITIGNEAFYGTQWYENQPNGLVYAGKVAYHYKGVMPENSEITLVDGTLSITNEAFKECANLASITIPNSVTIIGGEAFSGCSSLVDVFCYAENVPSASSNTFPSNYLTLYVPNASIDKYKTTSPWSGFKEIKALTDDTPEDPEIPGAERCATPTIVFADGELTFTCETEGVEFVPKVTCTPTYTLEGNKMRMGATFNISVYARREGYNKSEAATKTIEAKELGDVNGDGRLTIVDLTLLVKKIMGTP